LTFKITECTDCQLGEEVVTTIIKQDTLVWANDQVIADGFTDVFVRKRADGFLAATYKGIDPKLCPSPCCGGFLLNIDGIMYSTTSLPASLKFDDKKLGQKILVKIKPTVFSCKPIPVDISEAKYY
jgi:hypothetical protein